MSARQKSISNAGRANHPRKWFIASTKTGGESRRLAHRVCRYSFLSLPRGGLGERPQVKEDGAFEVPDSPQNCACLAQSNEVFASFCFNRVAGHVKESATRASLWLFPTTAPATELETLRHLALDSRASELKTDPSPKLQDLKVPRPAVARSRDSASKSRNSKLESLKPGFCWDET